MTNINQKARSRKTTNKARRESSHNNPKEQEIQMTTNQEARSRKTTITAQRESSSSHNFKEQERRKAV